MNALPFTNPCFPTVLVPVRVGAACAETPRARLARLEAQWDDASDAAHLLWALNTPTPANATEIRAEYDRLTAEVRAAHERVELEERAVRL